jgi:hypothetical protein
MFAKEHLIPEGHYKILRSREKLEIFSAPQNLVKGIFLLTKIRDTPDSP